MFHKFLTSSRYIVIIAVLGSFLASLASLLAGGAHTVNVLLGIFDNLNAKGGLKEISYSFVEVVDLFLIGTVFYIIALGLYGFVATLQPEAHFGRILAAYGGVFVAGSLVWGMVADGFRPDRYDVAGALLCLVGVAVIMYAPRAA